MSEAEQRIHNEAERIFIQVDEDVNSSPKYQERESEIMKLGRKMLERLGPDCAWFLDYEKLIYLRESFRLESAYKIGLEERGRYED